MDVFGEHEALRSRSVACHVSSEGIWRIDRFTGPTDVLEAVDRVYADHDRCLDCLTGIHDPQSTVHETLGASSGLRTVYTFRDVTSDCYEVPGLTYKYISKDVLSKSKRQGDTEEWWLPPPETTAASAISLPTSKRASGRDSLWNSPKSPSRRTGLKRP